MKIDVRLLWVFIIAFVCVEFSYAQSKPKRDPIEEDPRYKTIIEKVDQDVEASLKKDNMYGEMGSCHIFWARKKKILKERYNLDWKSPSEMNPQVEFD
ncbi:MAG: hypothetical protein ACOY3I_08910 [Verrucomicrobiota bacterium]